jgi:hypothetical protein
MKPPVEEKECRHRQPKSGALIGGSKLARLKTSGKQERINPNQESARQPRGIRRHIPPVPFDEGARPLELLKNVSPGSRYERPAQPIHIIPPARFIPGLPQLYMYLYKCILYCNNALQNAQCSDLHSLSLVEWTRSRHVRLENLISPQQIQVVRVRLYKQTALSFHPLRPSHLTIYRDNRIANLNAR